jgi:hypothetical protein
MAAKMRAQKPSRMVVEGEGESRDTNHGLWGRGHKNHPVPLHHYRVYMQGTLVKNTVMRSRLHCKKIVEHTLPMD